MAAKRMSDEALRLRLSRLRCPHCGQPPAHCSNGNDGVQVWCLCGATGPLGESYEDALTLYAARAHGWIAVGDFLPDDEVEVLAMDAQEDRYFLAHMVGGDWHTDDGALVERVTHWMYAPAGPGGSVG